MADILISYKREDRDRVEPFAHALEREGFSVWWDADLLIGATYSASIKTELNAARAVIPVWTNLVEVLPYRTAGKYRLRID